MTKPPPASLTIIEDTTGVWKGNIFLDLLHLALCVAVLKHLLLTFLLLRSIHSYYVSSQAKICQICFWILVKNVFFLGYQHYTLCLMVPKLLFLAFCVCVCVLGPLLHSASPQWYQPLQWCLLVWRGLWWETEEGDEILETLFYIGLKMWNKVFFFFLKILLGVLWCIDFTVNLK